MDRRDVRLLVGLAALSAVLLLAFAVGAVGGVLLYVAPVALLAAPLLSGRYVGEQAIERLTARRARAPRLVTARGLPAARRSARAFPRGGLLIAASLAERGPPALLLAR